VDKPKIKIVISDCHISAGRFFEGRLNPHEDFHFDDEFVDLLEYFSTGPYGVSSSGPADVEFILNGDFFDFLNVPYQGEFVDLITEDVSLYKTEAVIAGHPKIMAAIRRFVSLPNKKITYMIGNHDADLFFEKVRERITKEWDPEGGYPSSKVNILADRDRIFFSEGVEIQHGNQFESGTAIDFSKPILHAWGRPVLNLPWGSFYVLKIINRLKWEREYIDKIRPVKSFILFGLVTDPWFTLRFCFLTAFYFLQTRLVWASRRKTRQAFDVLKRDTRVFIDLEKEARAILTAQKDVQTVIFGHTHNPMYKIYPDGKQYINTGTWTKMVNLDWQGLGQQFRRTFTLIKIEDGKAFCELRQWVGEHSPHQIYGG